MNNCDIIRDLLPLYTDGVCSAASASLVDCHIAECESCRTELDSLRSAANDTADDERKAVSSFADAVKRRDRRRTVYTALIATAVVAALCFASIWALFFIETPVAYDHAAVYARVPEDGGVDVHIDIPYSKTYAELVSNDDGTEDVYLTAVCDNMTRLRGDDDLTDNLVRFGNSIIVSYNDETLHGHVESEDIAHIYYVTLDRSRCALSKNPAELSHADKGRMVLIYDKK